MLTWIPFLEPMNAMQPYWYATLLPMAFGISVIYRSLREWSYTTYWRSVVIMTMQIIVGIAVLAIALGVFVQVLIPAIS